MTNRTLSSDLRQMYEDLVEQYNDAKLNDNAPGQERLAKHISALAKQIKEHENHERETISRKEATRYANVICTVYAGIIKGYDGQVLDASTVLVEAAVELEKCAQEQLGE